MNKFGSRTQIALCCLIIAGCGSNHDYETIPTQRVSGQISINGVPAVGATVRFYPETPQAGTEYALMPSGTADEAGVYYLTTYEGDDGAPVGEYAVTIEWPDKDWRPPGGGMPPPPPDRLQGEYADPKKSTIHYTVVEGENQVPSINLDGVRILKGSRLP